MNLAPDDSIRVLHVDDEPDFAELTATFLEREGDQFAVETLSSASAGLDRLADDIDCIVSDYDMPGMDGIEFLEAVREEYPDLPFVLFTGKGSEEVASEAISAGVTDYLQKETGSSQYTVLANRIENVVDQHYAENRIERHERQLERQNDLFEKTQDLANVGAWEYDLRTEEAYWTDEVARIYGLDPNHEHTLDEAFEFYHPGDQPEIREAFERACTEGESYDLTLRLITSDGDQRWVRTRGEPEFEDGEIVRIRGSIQNVTDHYERARELRRYEAIIEALDDAVYAVDQSGRIKYVNERYVEMKNASRDELLGTPMRDWTSDEAAERIYEMVNEFERGIRDVAALEYEFETADGERFPTEVRFTDLEFPDGQRGRAGVIRDITDRKQTEERLAAYIDNVSDILGVVSGDGTFQDLSPSVERVLGYTPADLEGEMVFEYVHPEDRERVMTEFFEMVGPDETGAKCVEYRFEHADGSWKWLESIGSDRTDSVLEGYVITTRDISDRKERERELESQNERLEEFASVVSHDLRNPLNVAVTSVELAREERESPLLEKASRAHDRMEALIDDLLMLAREGTEESDFEPVELVDLVESCWLTVETADATLRVDMPEDVTILARESRLRQLLENLVRNAVEHGGEDVTVTIGDLEEGFYVADTGPGIPEAERRDVFEAGYSTSDEGTGFGLRIVERIAETHGWTVRVTRGPEGGARFEVTGIETPA